MTATSGPIRLKTELLACERDQRRLFGDLDLSLAAGDALELRGANGSGKTTLLLTLCGLNAPQEGRVLWDGAPISGSGRAAYQAALAWVGHKDGLKAELSPVENLEVARALCQAPTDIRPADALDRLGVQRRATRRACRTLSAGQRRRAALARLLMAESGLWLLDEPLAALDEAGEGIVRSLIEEHLAGGGIAVYSTHRPLRVAGSRELEICP
ncbi:MAG: cytochrome c biogenesis heme-transporting ATPase CcmA [Gammaproteobacteria bacterium]|jgi:heme exporter protein A|nr:cytochrome c biogenesis heme-transporting ATPase CcmA [Gammaproteobacteria bacterium]